MGLGTRRGSAGAGFVAAAHPRAETVEAIELNRRTPAEGSNSGLLPFLCQGGWHVARPVGVVALTATAWGAPAIDRGGIGSHRGGQDAAARRRTNDASAHRSRALLRTGPCDFIERFVDSQAHFVIVEKQNGAHEARLILHCCHTGGLMTREPAQRRNRLIQMRDCAIWSVDSLLGV